MAQPPQFRPGAPVGPPMMPPGPPGAPAAPGAPGMPPPPAMGQFNPGYPGVRQGSYEPYPAQPYPAVGDGGNKKKGKKAKKDAREDSDEEEEECKCPPQQPSTQIFICPPGYQPPGMGAPQGFVGYESGMGISPPQQQTPNQIDAAKLCQIQCYGGGKSKEESQTQVICCPPSSCRGCQRKGQQRPRSQGCMCQCCGQECPPRRAKKDQVGTMEGMMPASQQFLMFLQAYGLAAALIRDRNRREDERQQKEFEEKQKRSSSQSKDRKGSAKGKNKNNKKKE